MNYTIENEFLCAQINDFGAELCSLKSKVSGIEYLWQGNPTIWSGRSPILFPIIGQLYKGKFRYDGKEYRLPKHGFARESNFDMKSGNNNHIIFTLQSNEKTMQMYPFAFELIIRFEVNGSKLTVTHTVINKERKEMYFSIGAHPGFNCNIGDFLEFEKVESLQTERIDNNAIIVDEKFPLIENSRIVEITKDLFIKDALFLSGYKSSSIKLKSPEHNRELNLDFGTAPYLGIWAKPAAPYVCIEPWYGINDSYHFVEDFSHKRGIQELQANSSFSFAWSVEIIEPNT